MIKAPPAVWVRKHIWRKGINTNNWVFHDLPSQTPEWCCRICIPMIKQHPITTLEEILAHIETEEHQSLLTMAALAGDLNPTY